MPCRTRALALALSCLVTTASAARAVCPLNHFSVGSTPPTSSLPVDSRIFLGSSSGSASYNIPAGTLQANSRCSGSQGECGSSAGMFIEDDFTVSGLAPGTPVSLNAHFVVDLSGSCSTVCANGSANIQDGIGNTVTASGPQSSDDFFLPVQAVAGQAFRLHFEVSCSNLGPIGASAQGAFSFTGLPAGTGITSCQGYASGTPVAARASSWGSVKILYR